MTRYQEHAWPLLTGPTASGKSSLALALAERTGGAIVSFDAMQVYRGMDIGTAKASQQEQAEIPHYLLDISDPTTRFTVRNWYDETVVVLERLKAKQQLPIGVGGTPQYVTAMIEGVLPGAWPEDLELRQALAQEAEQAGEEGWLRLHERLQAVDPAKADRLHPNDHKRVLRALEVFELTGKPLSELEREEEAKREVHYPFQAFAIRWERAQLYERINQRVDQMMEEGLLDEVQALYRPLAEGEDPLYSTARQAIGYKEFFAHLEGQSSLEEAVQQVKQNTRRYAKRQLSWYRNKPWITWLEPGDPDELALRILENLDSIYA